MNLYKLRVLYPSSNKYKTDKSYTEEVYATNLLYIKNSLVFKEDNHMVAIYPATYTIVESVTNA